MLLFTPIFIATHSLVIIHNTMFMYIKECQCPFPIMSALTSGLSALSMSSQCTHLQDWRGTHQVMHPHPPQTLISFPDPTYSLTYSTWPMHSTTLLEGYMSGHVGTQSCTCLSPLHRSHIHTILTYAYNYCMAQRSLSTCLNILHTWYTIEDSLIGKYLYQSWNV